MVEDLTDSLGLRRRELWVRRTHGMDDGCVVLSFKDTMEKSWKERDRVSGSQIDENRLLTMLCQLVDANHHNTTFKPS